MKPPHRPRSRGSTAKLLRLVKLPKTGTPCQFPSVFCAVDSCEQSLTWTSTDIYRCTNWHKIILFMQCIIQSCKLFLHAQSLFKVVNIYTEWSKTLQKECLKNTFFRILAAAFPLQFRKVYVATVTTSLGHNACIGQLPVLLQTDVLNKFLKTLTKENHR